MTSSNITAQRQPLVHDFVSEHLVGLGVDFGIDRTLLHFIHPGVPSVTE